MCGIAGIVGLQARKSPHILPTMLKAIAHRGPDAEGIWSDKHAELGHRRLSILDTSVAANQPMIHPSQRYIVTFNGEIYNFQDVRHILENKGYTFHTTSDTEVILHAWAEWGPKSLAFFEGMFVFAVWDVQEQTLFIARDRFGEKPLFTFFQEGTLVFASEMRALLQHPLCPRTLNPQAIHQFLHYNYLLSDTCIFQDVYKLPAAHLLVYKVGQDPITSCYWQLSDAFHQPKHTASESELLEEWSHLFTDVVAKTSISDVALGAFLSGGVDSSTIVAAMTRHQDPGLVQTFSIGFQEDSFNELDKSQRVSEHLHVQHHTQVLQSKSLDDLAQIVSYTDEPFADTSMIPTYYLAQFTRQSVTVALSGDAGDELFAGYETYKADQLHQWARHLPFQKWASSVMRLLPDQFQKVGWDYKIKKFTEGLALSSQQAHVFWRSIFTNVQDLLHPQHHDLLSLNPYDAFTKYYADVATCPLLDQHLYVDMKTWLVDDILVKVDRMSMAHSLESRAPFLNHKLAEWIIRLPTSLKMRYGHTKYLLKKSQQAYLPREIIYGKKEGFSAPVGHWFTAQTRDLTLSGPLTQWVSQAALEKLWSEHLERRKDNSYKLFGLVCLALWLERTS